MPIPEWKLDETAEDAEAYQFKNVNPKLVFLLALAAGFLAVTIIYLGYVALSLAIDAGYISEPPRLQSFAD